METRTSLGIVAILDDDGKVLLLNLAQLKFVDKIRAGYCRLVFGDQVEVRLKGPGANKLIEMLARTAVTTSGEPIKGPVEKTLKEPSDQSES